MTRSKLFLGVLLSGMIIVMPLSGQARITKSGDDSPSLRPPADSSIPLKSGFGLLTTLSELKSSLEEKIRDKKWDNDERIYDKIRSIRNAYQVLLFDLMIEETYSNGEFLYDLALLVSNSSQMTLFRELVYLRINNSDGIYNQILQVKNVHQEAVVRHYLGLTARNRAINRTVFSAVLKLMTSEQAAGFLMRNPDPNTGVVGLNK